MPVSTIAQAATETGQIAARLVMDEARNGLDHPHRNVLIPPSLIVRDSSVRPG